MRRVNRLGIVVVLAVAPLSAPAFAGTVTVGGFYTELAQAQHLVSVDALSAEANLRGAGFDLPKLELDKSLTEGDVTAISRAFGVAVTTQRPSQQVRDSQMNTFMSSFRSRLGAPTAGGGQPRTPGRGPSGLDPAHSGNGKGLKKGHHKSVVEPF